MKHTFDVDVAKEYGIEEAILMENIYFWISKNAANGKHFHDGRYWTYNSKKAFTLLFPYMTERKIRYALENLVHEDLLLVGNYNKLKLDRTKWYTLSDKALKIYDTYNINSLEQTKWDDCNGQNCQMEQTKLSNVTDKIVQAIPDINTNINKNINCSSSYNPINDLQFMLGFLPTGYQAEKFVSLYSEVGEIVFHKALEKAAKKNARNYNYVESVARGLAEGKDFDNLPKEAEPEKPPEQELTEKEKAAYARLEAKYKGMKNGREH